MTVDESDGMRRRVCVAASLSYLSFFGAQARKLSLPRSLGLAEGGLTRHTRTSDGDAATEVFERILRVLG